MTQGKIERWHQTLKNRILLEHYYLPEDLSAHIEAFVEHYNHRRYHESLKNLILTQGLNVTADLGAWYERDGRFDLVATFDDQGIGKINTDGLDADQYLSGSWDGIGEVPVTQLFEWPKGVTYQRFQSKSSALGSILYSTISPAMSPCSRHAFNNE